MSKFKLTIVIVMAVVVLMIEEDAVFSWINFQNF